MHGRGPRRHIHFNDAMCAIRYGVDVREGTARQGSIRKATFQGKQVVEGIVNAQANACAG